MSKIIKPILITAAVVGLSVITAGAGIPLISAVGASIANTALGIGTALGLSAGLTATAVGALALGAGSVGLNALAPKMPKATLANLDRLNASMVASAPRKIVFGETAMATDIRYVEPSGTDQEYIDYVLHLASHKSQAVSTMYIEDKLAWTAAGGVQGEYVGYLTVETITEAGAGAYHTVNGGTRWGSAQRLTGCTTMKIRIKRTGNVKKAASPLAGGLPGRLTIIGKGMPVYDPRLDSTVPGGSGSHRADDCSTWAYTAGGDDIGANPALQALAYHLGWKINGVVSVGMGIPAERLDLEAFAVAANACEEAVTLAAGGTQWRYETGGVLSDFDDPRAVCQAFCDATNGWFDDSSGKIGFYVAVNDLTGDLPVFTDDDVLSGGTYKPFADTAWNIIRGRNPDPSTPALYQPTDYPEQSLASTDGIDRAFPLDLGLVQEKRRVQRIAKQALQRLQYQGLFSATFGLRAWQLNRGQVIKLTFSPLGWSERLFRVIAMTFNADATVALVLREENAAIYAWDADETASVTPAAPVSYDPLNSPFILAAEEAGTTADWPMVTGTGRPADYATVGAVIGTNLSGTFTSSNAATFFASNALSSSMIADLAAAKLTGAITSTQITDGAIETPKLAAGAVTTAKLAASAITAEKIAANTITANELATSELITVTAQIANGIITTAKIGDAQITTAKIADASITNAKINDLSADKITAGTINTSRLNIDGITLTNSGGTLIISNGGVNTTQIAVQAVTRVANASYIGPYAIDYTSTTSSPFDMLDVSLSNPTGIVKVESDFYLQNPDPNAWSPATTILTRLIRQQSGYSDVALTDWIEGPQVPWRSIIDTPVSGVTVTYVIQAAAGGGLDPAATFYISHINLVVTEVKR